MGMTLVTNSVIHWKACDLCEVTGKQRIGQRLTALVIDSRRHCNIDCTNVNSFNHILPFLSVMSAPKDDTLGVTRSLPVLD